MACDHSPDFYLMEVVDEQFMGGAGHVIDAKVPCSSCGETTVIRFTISEDDVKWDEEDQDDEQV